MLSDETKLDLGENLNHNERNVNNEVEISTSTSSIVENQEKKLEAQVEEPLDALPKRGLKFFLIFVSDQTIIATALPAIGKEFQQFNLISWLASGYLLTQASFAAIYGKLTDIFGRKSLCIVAITLFEIGSFLCGAAPDMNTLIIGRIVAGIGGAGIFTIVLVIIADIVSYEDRGKFQGLIFAVFGVASVVGPLAGGGFTDSAATWRWCFYINLPIGVLTLLVVAVYLPEPKALESSNFWQKIKRIDFIGLILQLISIVCFAVIVQAGGNVIPWNDWKSVLLFVLSFVFGVLFVVWEWKFAPEPLIPVTLFSNKSVGLLVAANFLLGTAILSFVFYISVYFQVILGESATVGGLGTIPLVLGLVILSILSGQLVSRYNRYWIFLLLGTVILMIGSVFMATIQVNTSKAVQMIYLTILGIGLGFLGQTVLLAIQASVTPDMIAIATSVAIFSNTIGGLVGIAVTGSVYNNAVVANLAGLVSAKTASEIVLNPVTIKSISADILPKVLEAVCAAIRTSFLTVVPYSVILFILVLFIKEYDSGVSAVVITIFSALISTISSHDHVPDSVLSAIQLLWVNLIMDTFAALALATDLPTEELLNRKPSKKTDSLINREMWCQIIGQAIYQIVVCFIIYLKPYNIFTFVSPPVSLFADHFTPTVVFNTFVLCQLFNELNSRSITRDTNVFAGVSKNYTFIFIITFSILMQILIVQFGSTIFHIIPGGLDLRSWLICIAFGSGSLPVGFLIRIFPIKQPSEEEIQHVIHHEIEHEVLELQKILITGVEPEVGKNLNQFEREKWKDAIKKTATEVRVLAAFKATARDAFHEGALIGAQAAIHALKPINSPSVLDLSNIMEMSDHEINKTAEVGSPSLRPSQVPNSAGIPLMRPNSRELWKVAGTKVRRQVTVVEAFRRYRKDPIVLDSESVHSQYSQQGKI
ncbi:hypothetical protein HK099_008632, partial [Clydaea vesicula]